MTRGSGLTGDFEEADQQDLLRLIDELTPRLTAAEARRLLSILVRAQSSPPTDKKSFVTRINRLFDLYRVRIDTGDGALYRLKYLPGGSGYGHIYLLDGFSRNFNTFCVSTLRLADASGRFEGNRYVTESQASAPVLVGAPQSTRDLPDLDHSS